MLNVPIEFQTPILLMVAAFNFMLGLIIFLSGKSNSSKSFSITSFAVALWSIGIAFFIVPGITKYTILLSNINYILGSVIAYSYLVFCFYFGSEDSTPSPRFLVSSVLSWVAVIIIVILPGLVISGYAEVNQVKADQYGPLYMIYSSIVSAYLFIGLYFLYKKYRVVEAQIRRQIRFIFVGTSISIFVAIAFNIVLPSIFNISDYVWAGAT